MKRWLLWRLELDEFADAIDDFIEAAEQLKPPKAKFALTAREPVRRLSRPL